MLDGAGITPAITNEVGLYMTPEPRDMSLLPRNTRVNAHRTKTITDRRNRSNNANIAVPNDRPRSVRPSDRNTQYEFVFHFLEFSCNLQYEFVCHLLESSCNVQYEFVFHVLESSCNVHRLQTHCRVVY